MYLVRILEEEWLLGSAGAYLETRQPSGFHIAGWGAEPAPVGQELGAHVRCGQA